MLIFAVDPVVALVCSENEYQTALESSLTNWNNLYYCISSFLIPYKPVVNGYNTHRHSCSILSFSKMNIGLRYIQKQRLVTLKFTIQYIFQSAEANHMYIKTFFCQINMQ